MASLARAINRRMLFIVILALSGLLAIAQLTAAEPRAPDRLASASAASIVISPTVTGGFGSPGGSASFRLRINNLSGAADTFDLFPNSPWPMTIYRLDGVTPLTDTDGDGVVDTGPVVANWYASIVVKLAVPADATVGQYRTGTLTVQSSNIPAQNTAATFTAAVPALFAQSYAPNDQPYLSVNRLYLQTNQPTAASYGYNPVIASAPNGHVWQVWEQGRTNANGKKVYELFMAVFDGQGQIVRPVTAITNLDSAVENTHDSHPALAVAPNGNVGLTWYRTRTDAAGNFNYNIFTLILDQTGSALLAPTNLTNNAQWGTSLTPNVPQFFEPVIAATTDNRFTVMWRQQFFNGTSTKNTLWYTVRNTGVIKAVAQFGTDTCSYQPHLTALFDGSLFLVQETCAKVAYARLNSSGGLLNSPTVLTGYTGNDGPVAAQLTNGHVLLAWQHNTGVRYALQYALLNAALGVLKAPTDLPSISPVGDDAISATRAADLGVLTWTDVFTDHPNLYYALLDNSGGLVTPPIIIATDLSQQLAVAANGQGNTTLPIDTTPPNNPTSLNSLSHTLNQWSNDNTIEVTWSGASDTGSGIGGYSIGWDTNPIGVPDTQRDALAASIISTSPPLADGAWYFHLRAVDNDGNWATTAAHLGPFKIDTTPPQSAAQSPLYAVGPFTVTWSGTDLGSSIAGYNLWVRDGASSWTKWLTSTLTTSGMFTGAIGHTYYFRSQASDAANNLENPLPPDGDTRTIAAAFQIDGRVFNQRRAPVFNARVETQPSALTATHTDTHGAYTLYFVNSGVFTLTASRSGFGALPPRHNLILTHTQAGFDFVLPPLNDAIVNGGWETGDFTGWTIDPGITATVEMSAAHTGWFGLQLTAPFTGTESLRVLTQTFVVTGPQPALSLIYRVTDGSGADFAIDIESEADTISHTLSLTPGDWTHDWIDLGPFVNQAVTLTLGFQNPAVAQVIDFDEISVGDTQTGVYSIFLPLVRRH